MKPKTAVCRIYLSLQTANILNFQRKNLQFQSSIVDNGRDYVLHYVGMSNMQIFNFFFASSL
jgi:hypothetical protein